MNIYYNNKMGVSGYFSYIAKNHARIIKKLISQIKN